MKGFLIVLVAMAFLFPVGRVWADNSQAISQKNQIIQLKQNQILAYSRAIRAKKLQLDVLGYQYGKALGSGETLKALGVLAQQNAVRADIKNSETDIEVAQAEIEALQAEIEVLKASEP